MDGVTKSLLEVVCVVEGSLCVLRSLVRIYFQKPLLVSKRKGNFIRKVGQHGIPKSLLTSPDFWGQSTVDKTLCS